MDRISLETGRLSDKLCVLLDVPRMPRSRANSCLGSRASCFEKNDSIVKESLPDAQVLIV